MADFLVDPTQIKCKFFDQISNYVGFPMTNDDAKLSPSLTEMENLSLEESISVERFLFGESSKEMQAKAFFLQIKQNDPELFKDLERQAMLAINGIRSRQKPKSKVGVLKTLFAWNPELDPTKSADTYGVRAFISSLAANKQEAGKAKRFYDRTIDAFFKQLFLKASEEVSKKEKLSGNIADQQKRKKTTTTPTQQRA